MTRWSDSFRPCGFRMLAWRFSSILRYSGFEGSMFVSRRSTAMAGPEKRHRKESFRVNFQSHGPVGDLQLIVLRWPCASSWQGMKESYSLGDSPCDHAT